MKKKIYFLAILLLATISSFAQSVELPVYMDFEEFTGLDISLTYPGWNEGNGYGNTPTIGESGWYLSNVLFGKCAGVSLNSNTHNEWLISPKFEATENTHLTFRLAATRFYDEPAMGHLGFDDSLCVMFATGNIFTPVFTVKTANQPNENFVLYNVDLSQFAGSEIRIAFFATDGYEETGLCALHLDDVLISNVSAYDGYLFSLLSPGKNECFEQNQEVKVRMLNTGTETLQNIPVRVKIRGENNENIFNVFSQELEPNESADFVVGETDMSAVGTYSISAELMIEGDEVTQNDYLQATDFINPELVALPLDRLHFTDFYDQNLQEVHPGWHEARGKNFPAANIDTDWQGDNLSDRKTASVYFVNVGTEDWIVGPRFFVSPNTKISFVAALEPDNAFVMGADDKLQIMVSENCGETWQVAGVVDASSGLSEVFSEFEFSLNAFENEYVMVAFYATTGNIMNFEKYMIHIDDVDIVSYLPSDVGVVEILSPVNSCSFTNSETVTVRIKNFSDEFIPAFPVQFTDHTQTYSAEMLPQGIPARGTIDYTFSQTANLENTDNPFLNATTLLSGDPNLQNNSIVQYFYSQAYDFFLAGTYKMSFEEAESNESWSVVNNNGDEKTWVRYESGNNANNGDFSYRYESNGTTAASDDWLFSPCFTLEANQQYSVKFYYRNLATSYPEKLRLLCGTMPTPSAMTETIVDLGSISNGNYLASETVFTPTVSGSYYFGWEAYGEADMFGLHVDDIQIYPVMNNDLEAISLQIPIVKNPNDCSYENSTEVVAKIANIGTTDYTNAEVFLSINSFLYPSVETSIPAGDTVTVTFQQGISINPIQPNNYDVFVSEVNDQNTGNNSFNLYNHIIADFTTGFEDANTLTDWTQHSSAGNNVWNRVTDPAVAHSGLSCYGIRTDSNNGNTANDDWLISECFQLSNEACYTISFWYRSRYSTENLELYFGTSPDISSMQSLANIGDFNSNEYLFFELPFNIETSDTYYFAWRTTGSTSSRYWVYIDDISIKQALLGGNMELTYNIIDKEVLFNSNAENATNILWDFGDGNFSTEENPTHTYSENGTYTAILTAEINCATVSQTAEIEIYCNEIADIIVENISISPGTPVLFSTETTGVAYLWDFGDGNYSTEAAPTHTYAFPGAFTINLVVFNSCGNAYASTNLDVLGKEVISENRITVFPNPTNNFLSINSDYNIQSISVTTIEGRELMRQNVATGQKNYEISTSQWANGLYFLTVVTAQGKYVTSFVVNK